MLKPVIDSIATLGRTLLLVDITPKYEQVKNDDGKFERTEKEDIPESTIVAFENLTITPYVQNGWIQLSSKTDKCSVCDEE